MVELLAKIGKKKSNPKNVLLRKLSLQLLNIFYSGATNIQCFFCFFYSKLVFVQTKVKKVSLEQEGCAAQPD